MIRAIQLETAARLEKDSPALTNPAVAHCVEVWKSARQESLANGKDKYYAGRDAVLAYCAALPPLSGDQNISDFIACVGYGMAIEIFPETRGLNLLHAARVAHGTTPKETKKPKSAAA